MKKILYLILFLSLVIPFREVNATPIELEPATSDPTATFVPLRANKYYGMLTDGRLCQKFKPSRSFLSTFVDVRASTGPSGSTSNIYLNVYTDSGNMPSEEFHTYNPPSTFKDGRNTMTRFTSESFAAVTPNTSYWLCMEGRGDGYWYADSPDGGFYASTYNYGFAMAGYDQHGDEDFGFIVYSSNALPEPDPIPEPDPDPITDPNPDPIVTSTPLPEGVTEGTGAAPKAPTTTIKSPTSLTVVDVPDDQGNSLKIGWKASTTSDIDGYKVFRSTEATKNFKEVAKTKKTILTFTDNEATIGTKYYYQVRAYKGTKESVSSNTANGTSVDNVAPATPQNTSYTKRAEEAYIISWDKNTETDLSGYTLLVTDSNDPNTVLATIDIPKDSSQYTLELAEYSKLAPDGSFIFQLIAKDAQSNVSDKAIVQGAQTSNEVTPNTPEVAVDADDLLLKNSPTIWYLIGGGSILLLALAGGGLYWFKFRKKKTPTIVTESKPIEPYN